MSNNYLDINDHPHHCSSYLGFACDCSKKSIRERNMAKSGKRILKGLEDAIAFQKGDKSRGRLITITPDNIMSKLGKLPPKRRKRIEKRAKQLIERELMAKNKQGHQAKENAMPGKPPSGGSSAKKKDKISEREMHEVGIRCEMLNIVANSKGNNYDVHTLIKEANYLVQFALHGTIKEGE